MMIDGKQGVRIPVRRNGDPVVKSQSEGDIPQMAEDNAGEMHSGCEGDCAEWRDTALRLKAEMITYRRRQERWAEDEVQREKDRLLVGFLGVLDDLEQAVTHLNPDSSSHQAVKIAYNNMLKLLVLEGVERIDAQGAPFDPQWHDAVAMVPALYSQRTVMQVLEVVDNGYRIGDRLLKPSRVVVGKRGMP